MSGEDVAAPVFVPHGAIRFELIVFLLLVATFAAVLFKDAFVERRFEIDRGNAAGVSSYSYADESAGGRSTIAVSPREALTWTCRISAGFAFPFCGFGLSFDAAHNGGGRDMSRFERVVLDLDYRGPSKQLKITFKSADPRFVDPGIGMNAQPSFIQFPVIPGRNHVELRLADAAVEEWWASAHKALPDAGRPHFGNVVAIDLQTGTGALPGRHDFALRLVSLRGNAITPENWYLVLLGIWTGLAALYLVHRMRAMRQEHAARQRALVAEARLLQQARDAAESASQAKSRFLAHMSHELRTPLNAILGYAQILKASGLDERHARAAGTIQQSGEHLLSLIGDILDISRIEAGRLELAPRAIDLRQFVRDVADMIRVRAQAKDLAFHWAVAADVPRAVVADDKCLRQVLINMLGNAVKFTDRGEVRLKVGVVSTGGGDIRLRFEVGDTGTGIPEDRLQAIFEPFEQAGDRAQRAGGTGLGLSISQRIVALMDSELQVESMVGVGSRFWFDVTLPLADSTALPAAASDTDGSATPQPRVFAAVPEGACMERLHDLAMAGNMRSLRAEAERLMEQDAALRPFAEELRALACSYQSRAILDLVEKHKNESVGV